MRILVIGGTGFIGGAVTRALAERGHEVAVLSRNPPSRLGNGSFDSVQHISGDMERLSAHREQIRAFGPEIAVHTVLYTEAHAKAALEALTGIAGRLVALSSCDVYRNYSGLLRTSFEDPDPTPLEERSPLRAELYPYRDADDFAWEHKHDYEKIDVERRLFAQHDIEPTVLRLAAVYGPAVAGRGDPHHRFRHYVARMHWRRPLIVVEQGQLGWRFSHVYVEAVANAVVAAAETLKEGPKLLNVSEQPTPTVGQRIAALAELFDWQGAVLEVPYESLPVEMGMGADWSYDMAVSSELARKELGVFDQVRYRQALEATVAWEVEMLPAEPPEEYRKLFATEDEAARAGV
jgi:nucleoside-diphosphate-sugar epimerase